MPNRAAILVLQIVIGYTKSSYKNQPEGLPPADIQKVLFIFEYSVYTSGAVDGLKLMVALSPQLMLLGTVLPTGFQNQMVLNPTPGLKNRHLPA